MPRIQGFQAAPSQTDPRKFTLAVHVEVEDAVEAARVLARVHSLFAGQEIGQASNHMLAKLALEDLHRRKEAEARHEFEEAKARKRAAENIAKDAEDVKDWEESEAVAPAPPEISVVPEPEPEPDRPGMDPARILAAYDAQEAELPDVQEGAHYVKGGLYEGVEITRVQTSKAQGFGVLSLVDGRKVKYDLNSGHVIAVKGEVSTPPSEPVTVAPDASDDEIAAALIENTERNMPDPMPEWVDSLTGAKSVKEALTMASHHVEAGTLVEWAVSMRENVPAFAKVNSKTFRKRVERAIAMMAPAKKGATA